jgi:hypothetical protein
VLLEQLLLGWLMEVNRLERLLVMHLSHLRL